MTRGWAVAAVFLVFATGCQSEKPGQARSKLTLTGASTLAPLMSEVARRFEAQNPGVRVDVQMGGLLARRDGCAAGPGRYRHGLARSQA
jgi:ABC-type phosphate transport system substrate-binding protein